MKRFLTPYIYSLIFCCCFSGLSAQHIVLKITAKDSINNVLLQNIEFKKKHTNKDSLIVEVNSFRKHLESIGFFNHRLDTILKKDSIYTAHFNLGKSFKTIKVFYDKNQIQKEVLPRESKNITNTYFEVPIEYLQKYLQDLLQIFVEKGNSFTTIKLTDVAITDNLITAKLNVTTAATRTIDKIVVKGIDNYPKTYMSKYLGLRKNTLFSQKNLTEISRQLNALPFVSELKPPEVLFTKDSTYVYVYLKKKKSNQFDGLIGFFTNEENSRLKFNGYLDVTLNNIFNGGENIQLNWQNNGNDRQLFNFSLEAPYLFKSSFTPTINLNIYKQDSTFINTTTNIAVQYAINYKNNIGLSFISETSNNLLDNTISNIDSYITNLYGLNYSYSVFNNSSIYPVKLNTLIDIHMGQRAIKNLDTQQTKLGLTLSYLWNLNAKNTVYMRSINKILFSDNYLTNELYRIGGVNTIRGFNEESIATSLYNIVNLEYRFMTNSASYLYSITDFAYVENKLESLDQKIYSLGLGYAFNTKLGLLNLSYAIGKSDKLPFDLNNSRFHIKILSFF